MNTSSLKASTAAFTPEDLAMLGETSGSDLPAGFVDLIKLMQGMSREMAPGDAKYIPGAALGDYIIPRLDEQILAKGAVGYHLALIDEAGHDETYLTDAFQVAIAPTLLDYAGSIVEASTPNGV